MPESTSNTSQRISVVASQRQPERNAQVHYSSAASESHNYHKGVSCFYLGNIEQTVQSEVIDGYLTKHGVRPNALHIIPSKKESAIIGVKVLINSVDKDKLMAIVLPRGVYVRQWYDREHKSRSHGNRYYYGSEKYRHY
jgi:hypothetical protein